MTPYRVLAALSAFAASSALASPYAAPVFPPAGPWAGNVAASRHMPSTAERALNVKYEAKSEALRAEMVALKEANGGKLTREDRARLHQKAEALISSYNHDLSLLKE